MWVFKESQRQRFEFWGNLHRSSEKKSTCNQEHFWRWCLLHLSMYVSPPHLYTPKSKSIKYLQHSSLKYCNIRSFVFCYFISYTEAEKQQNGTERCLLHRLLSRSPFFTFRSKRKIFKINDSNSMNLTFHSSLYESNHSSSKLNLSRWTYFFRKLTLKNSIFYCTCISKKMMSEAVFLLLITTQTSHHS